MRRPTGALLLAAALAALEGSASVGAEAARHSTRHRTGANPIRKVIALLQMMEQKTREEGEQRQELFDKFMCYCKSSKESLAKSVASATDRMPQLESSIQEATAMKQQLSEELKQHMVEREEAQKAMDTAQALGAEQSRTLLAEQTELKSNINALSQAMTAIKKNTGNFLQTGAASVLRKLSLSMDMATSDRDLLASFLVGEDGVSAPQSGEIFGILQEMHDEMERDLKKVMDQAASVLMETESLIAAKKREIAAASVAIEDKTKREGELAVKIVGMKGELENCQEGLAKDQQFLVDLEKSCQVKTQEWALYQKMQSEELVAISETIKLLNDDDALDLFKKTLPNPAASFLQLQVTSKDIRNRAVDILRAVPSKDARLDLLEMAVRGQKQGFDEIIAKIDDLATLLREEQKQDENKQAFCLSEIDKTEDKLKAAMRGVSDKQAVIADAEDSLEEITATIQALLSSIQELDKQVAEATQARKEEHAASVSELAQNSAAKSLLEMAKNKMNKFYNAKLFKESSAPKTEEDRIVANMGGSMLSTKEEESRRQLGFEQRLGKQPEADLKYEKKSAEHGGAVAMIEMLREDLIAKIAELETEEKMAQADYEKYIEDSASKRALDAKAMADQEGAKAELEGNLHEDKESEGAQKDLVVTTKKELEGLHADCDWLLKNFELRRQARANEQDSISKAKAVLSGASYDF